MINTRTMPVGRLCHYLYKSFFPQSLGQRVLRALTQIVEIEVATYNRFPLGIYVGLQYFYKCFIRVVVIRIR